MNHINKVLNKFNISKLIVPNIQKTRRIILEETNNHSIVLFHWKKNQRVPIHNHDGNCIFKMLNGEIYETRYNKNGIQYNLLNSNSEGNISNGERHTMLPLRNSISIHYYNPVPKKLCPTMDHIKLK